MTRGFARAALVFGVALAAALAPAAAIAKKEKAAEEPAAGAKQEGPPTWYAQRLTHGDAPVSVEQFWSKGRKLRAEMVVQGMSVVTLVNGDCYMIIDETQLNGICIKRAPEALAADQKHPNERPFGREGDELLKRGGELVRSDSRAEQPVRVLRATDDRGRREVWITDDKRKLPVKLEFVARDNGLRTQTDYIDWLSGMSLPDALFEPDPRVRIETIEYADYVARSAEGPVGPAPVLFGPLLHGK